MNLAILNNLVSVLLTQKIFDNVFVLMAHGQNKDNGAILRIDSNGVFELISPTIALADEEDHKTQLSFAIAEFFNDKVEELEDEIANLEEIITSINKYIENLRELDCMDGWDDIEDNHYRNLSCAIDDLRTISEKTSNKIAEKTNAIKKMKGQI